MSVKYYDSIVDLPFGLFKQCSVKNNYYALVIEGQPKIEELERAWINIALEYKDRMMGEEGKMHHNLLLESGLLESKLIKINICLQRLGIEVDHPEINPKRKYIDDLNQFVESNFVFDHLKPEEFKAELKRAKNRSKGVLMNLQIKQSNLKALNEKGNNQTKPTFEYWDSILNELSLFAKYEIGDSITVSRFCDMVQKCNKYRDAVNSPKINQQDNARRINR